MVVLLFDVLNQMWKIDNIFDKEVGNDWKYDCPVSEPALPLSQTGVKTCSAYIYPHLTIIEFCLAIM